MESYLFIITKIIYKDWITIIIYNILLYMIIQLLRFLTNEYIGRQYLWIIQQLYQQNHSLEYLLEKGELKFDQLTEYLKYLIKINIVMIEKKNETISYKLNQVNLLYYQRIGKYIKYINLFYNKEELAIIKYYLENQTSSIEQCLKVVCVKKNDEEKYKEIFLELLKKNLLYEDEKAFDFKVCNMIEQEAVVKSIQKQPEVEKIEKITKSKKKSSKTIEIKPISNQNNFKFLENHYYNVSKSAILQQIFDWLLAQNVINKYQFEKQQKEVINLLNLPKYTFPIDHFNNTKEKSPKLQLIKVIKQNLIENFIAEKYTKNGLLVYNTLYKNPYIGEKQLLQRTMLQLKQIRHACNVLIQSGIVKVTEVKIQKVATQIFYIVKNQIEKYYLNYISKIIINLHILSKKSQEQYNRQLIKGKQVSLQKLLKLEISLSKLDDKLILFGY